MEFVLARIQFTFNIKMAISIGTAVWYYDITKESLCFFNFIK